MDSGHGADGGSEALSGSAAPAVAADPACAATGYPFGWFAVCRSQELAVGDVRPIRAFAQDFALWRGEDGRPRMLPARCPHAGFSMAHGRVCGDWLECPAHAWRWDEAGALRDIPYAVKPIRAPAERRRPRWPACDSNGYVMAWHGADRGEATWVPDRCAAAATGVPLGEPGTWRIAASLDTVHGYVWQAAGPSPVFVADGVRATLAEAAGWKVADLCGPGQAIVRDPSRPDLRMTVVALPVERDLTEVRVAVHVDGASADHAACAAVAARWLDDARAVLDAGTAIGVPALGVPDAARAARRWLAQFGLPIASPGPMSPGA